MSKVGSARTKCSVCNRLVIDKDYCPVHFRQLPEDLQDIIRRYTNRQGHVDKAVYKLAVKAAKRYFEDSDEPGN